MNHNRFAAFREMCTKDKPLGTPFKWAKGGEQTTMPLLRKENGETCRTEEENIAHLLASF